MVFRCKMNVLLVALPFCEEVQNKHRYHHYTWEGINDNTWWNIIILGTNNCSTVNPNGGIALHFTSCASSSSRIETNKKDTEVSSSHPSAATCGEHPSSTGLWPLGKFGRTVEDGKEIRSQGKEERSQCPRSPQQRRVWRELCGAFSFNSIGTGRFIMGASLTNETITDGQNGNIVLQFLTSPGMEG